MLGRCYFFEHNHKRASADDDSAEPEEEDDMNAVPQLKQAREDRVAVAREKFFSRGVLPEEDVSPLILRSWSRCRDSGLDPRTTRAVDVAGRGQLEESRNQSSRLLNLASGVMEHVFDQIRASGSMVILADLDGMISTAWATLPSLTVRNASRCSRARAGTRPAWAPTASAPRCSSARRSRSSVPSTISTATSS